MRRLVCWVLVGAVVACGGPSGDAGSASTAPVSTSTTVVSTTAPTMGPPTSLQGPAAGATSTTMVATTATVTTPAPPAPSLVLRHDGLGPFDFGDEADEVAGGLVDVFGVQAEDLRFDCTVQVLPFGYGCVGSLRLLTWDGLTVVLSDGPFFREAGVAHFAGWSYRGGGAFELRTAAGIGIGSTVDDLRKAFGDRLHLPEAPDECRHDWVWRVCDQYPPENSLDCLGGTLSGAPGGEGVSVTYLDAGARSTC